MESHFEATFVTQQCLEHQNKIPVGKNPRQATNIQIRDSKQLQCFKPQAPPPEVYRKLDAHL